jgi:peptidoglycan/xylan/chitin deacetylase (PgdA/CDA1 family)
VNLLPILCYHSVAAQPADLIRPFAVDPSTFAAHLDLIAERGLETPTVSELLELKARRDQRLDRAVVITFDDGFADNGTAALPALRERGMRGTLFVTTGLLRGGTVPPTAPTLAPYMLSWSELPDVRDGGLEIGGHSHTHPQLDTLGRRAAREEVTRCKTMLEDALAAEVTTFAYPHGYSSPSVRRIVRAAGYRGACSVKNTLSSPLDDPFSMARLTVRADTTIDEIGAWLDRRGAPAPPAREAVRTRGWRLYRRTRAEIRRRPGRDPGWVV